MELTKLKNIGAEMEKKLSFIGINTAEDLVRLGSKETFLRLKVAYPEVCLVHLYVLQAVIDGLEFNMLPQNIKDELKAFSDSLK